MASMPDRPACPGGVRVDELLPNPHQPGRMYVRPFFILPSSLAAQDISREPILRHIEWQHDIGLVSTVAKRDAIIYQSRGEKIYTGIGEEGQLSPTLSSPNLTPLQEKSVPETPSTSSHSQSVRAEEQVVSPAAEAEASALIRESPSTNTNTSAGTRTSASGHRYMKIPENLDPNDLQEIRHALVELEGIRAQLTRRAELLETVQRGGWE
ncbi:hypothetical protein FQN50_007361 [Emmonsiellopsis sp. PD_5]|nr:hypothetical protein FQN50_007361 [Emmonsiellopsis sp. PD_5]